MNKKFQERVERLAAPAFKGSYNINFTFINLFHKIKIIEKRFQVEEKEIVFKYCGYRSKRMQCWFENEHVKSVLSKLPSPNIVQEAFATHRENSGMNYKFLLITDDLNNDDNWFYQKNKTWVLTLKTVLVTMENLFIEKGFDMTQFNQFKKVFKRGK